MGECSKESAFAILDAFYENGGNFIDTYVMSRTLLAYQMMVVNSSQFQQLSI